MLEHADELIRNAEKNGGYVILLACGSPDENDHRSASVYIASPKEHLTMMGEFHRKLPDVIREIINFSWL